MRNRHRTLVLAPLMIAMMAFGLTPAPAATPSLVLTDAVDFYAPQLVSVDAPSAAHRNALAGLGLDVTEHGSAGHLDVVLHSALDEQVLRDAGFTWQVEIADLIAREVERVRLDAAYAEATDVSPLPSGRDTYRMLDDYYSEIEDLVSDPANAGLAARVPVGTSLEGRPLTGIEIGVGVADAQGDLLPDDGRPVFLMFGVHHAREWPSAELPMEFAHDLLASYHAGDARVVDLLTRGRALIMPVSNPDGFDASRTSGEYVDLRAVDNGDIVSILATPGNAYKRKNCRYVDGQTQPAGTCILVPSPGGFGVGIDLNRNYGALWGGPGASGDVSSATYRGPEPFSEPETQAIRDLISTRQVTTLITNHTSGELILRPVGVQPSTIGPDGSPIGFAPDECFTDADGTDRGMQAIGEMMAAQNGYSNQFGWELYDTTGTTEDYSYNATGGYGYTFENMAGEFHPPYEQVVEAYTGEAPAAAGVTLDADGRPVRANGTLLTTAAGDTCGGEPVTHEVVGGGNREAFLIAFANAVDTATHATITGSAAPGSEITVSRTGDFPLWDGTPLTDTVTTTMVADDSGAFTFHVNPSTRPFVDSRKAPQLGDPIAAVETSGTATPTRSATHDLVVPADTDVIRATVSTSIPVNGQVVTYGEMHVALLRNGFPVTDDDGQPVEATEFGPVNTFLFRPEDGIEAGTYTLEVSNNLAVTSGYDLVAYAQDVLGEETLRTPETWTVSCNGTSTEVLVDRGGSVDVGDLCG